MSATTCSKCHGARHKPDCPEMYFASGRRRDDPGPRRPLPPFNPDLRIENPGGLSPKTLEFGRIFAGVTEQMLARHIAETAAAAKPEPVFELPPGLEEPAWLTGDAA